MTCPPPLLPSMHLPLLPFLLTRLLPPDFSLFPSVPGCSSLRASAHPLQPPSLSHFLQLRCHLPKRSSLTTPCTAWRSPLPTCITVIIASQYTVCICSYSGPPSPSTRIQTPQPQAPCLFDCCSIPFKAQPGKQTYT